MRPLIYWCLIAGNGYYSLFADPSDVKFPIEKIWEKKIESSFPQFSQKKLRPEGPSEFFGPPEIKAIVFIGVKSELNKNETKHLEGIEVFALDVPGGVFELREAFSSNFIGSPVSREKIQTLKEQVVKYWEKHDRPVVYVDIPNQEISDGVIQVLVIEGKFGKVVTRGNHWFSQSSIAKNFHFSNGDVILESKVLDDVAWINRNPFRHADAYFTKGSQEGFTDIELIVADRRPWRVYLGGDNTGSHATGQSRWFTGFNWGNAFDLGHVFSYQYTIGGAWHRFQSHTLHYTAPLPWRHQIIAYGGYATMHPRITGFRSHARSAQGSFRYEIPFNNAFKKRLRNIIFGFDIKSTNNNLNFIENTNDTIITGNVIVSQLVAQINCGAASRHHELSFSVEGFGSTGKIFPDGGNGDFQHLNPNAKNSYIYGRGLMSDVYTSSGGYQMAIILRGQFSSANLLPTEQFSLGGYDTVRGYDERVVNTDDAFCGNFELRTKKFAVLSLMGKQKYRDELQLLVFADYGWGKNKNAGLIENDVNQLISVGPGFRYTINPYLAARFDWGIRLHSIPFQKSPDSKFHFGLVASY